MDSVRFVFTFVDRGGGQGLAWGYQKHANHILNDLLFNAVHCHDTLGTCKKNGFNNRERKKK